MTHRELTKTLSAISFVAVSAAIMLVDAASFGGGGGGQGQGHFGHGLDGFLRLGHSPEQMMRSMEGKRKLQGGLSCTGVPIFASNDDITTGDCMSDWKKGEWQFYPKDFGELTNDVTHYECGSTNERIIVSNGIPDHSVKLGANGMIPCETYWYVSIPLVPTYEADDDDVSEIPPSGIIAMAMNGVPIFGAIENDSYGNAAEPGDDASIQDAQFWYGHATESKNPHYHSPKSGRENPTSDTLLGYAMDGYPIYGPVDNPDDVLDECNGRLVDEADLGTYRYHVRTIDQVDETLDYCVERSQSPLINWKYIVGCYRGSVVGTTVTTYDPQAALSLPSDCQIVHSTPQIDPPLLTRPNVIVMQPDDLPFYSQWGPPPNIPFFFRLDENPLPTVLPYMNRMRLQGLQMMQAYTTSPACGTSRFSTITGKYPSRAAYSREINHDKYVGKVTIPTTKLADIAGQTNDCSEENMAVAFRDAGYRTGVVGKWHLFKTEDDYTYAGTVDKIKECGFDTAEAIYAENLEEDIMEGGDFNHNMEWVTSEAIKFINQGDASEPFFLYVNPTVPHDSGSVYDALVNYTCTTTADIPNNPLPEEPMIKGMTLEYGGCEAYRETVIERANSTTDTDLGAVWIDDSVGAIMHALNDRGVLDDTVFLIQMDHGLDAKQTLYEHGTRILQFVHYPKGLGTDGKVFDGMVSTIDIAPTMFDFAGIAPPYQLDGTSWKDAIDDAAEEEQWKLNRCLLFENQQDRAVRCGCGKFVTIRKLEDSNTALFGDLLGYDAKDKMFFDLCEVGTTEYLAFPNDNPEVEDLMDWEDYADAVDNLKTIMQCFKVVTRPREDQDYATDCGANFDPSKMPLLPTE